MDTKFARDVLDQVLQDVYTMTNEASNQCDINSEDYHVQLERFKTLSEIHRLLIDKYSQISKL